MSPTETSVTPRCETCRSGKVRCDKNKPNCYRCVRLGKPCNYPQDPTLGSVGSFRSRHADWVPPTILPAISIPIVAREPAAVTDFAIVPAYAQSEDFEASTEPSVAGSDQFVTHSYSNDEDAEQIQLPTSIGDNIEIDFAVDLLDYDSYMGIMDGFEHAMPDFQTDWRIEIMAALSEIVLDPFLSTYHISLPNSMEFNQDEHRALDHYQHTYSLYRTTKDPRWSTHMVLLRLGSENRMIMHLLLAVSTNDLQNRNVHSSWSQLAHSHFQTGARLLIENMQENTETNHISLMASIFFIYLYMTKRQAVAPRQLRQLSLAVTSYVKKYDLDSLCTGPAQECNIPNGSVDSSRFNRSLLARLIMWIFDEDVKCSFQGAGGYFARHLTDHGARTKDVYDVSRNALSVYFGTEYPVVQNMDDQQNSTVLEFLWALMPVWQDINDLSQHHDQNLLHMRARIEQTFVLLEEKYLSVFQISADKTTPRTRIFVNADYDVVLFNALRVYYFRSTISDLKMDTPPEYQKCLKTLLTITSRTFASRNSELYDRLQWPLFIAGIETDDEVYRNWISMLSRGRAAAALERVLYIQNVSGKRMTMHEIRELLSDAEELTLPIPASNDPFLEIIQNQIDHQPGGYRYQVM